MRVPFRKAAPPPWGGHLTPAQWRFVAKPSDGAHVVSPDTLTAAQRVQYDELMAQIDAARREVQK